MTYSFEEDDLRGSLARIGETARVVFAAACATRLLPRYEEYIKKVGSTQPYGDSCISGLMRLWDCLVTGSHVLADIEEVMNECEAILPDEEQASNSHNPYAEDGAAAIYYALAASKSDSIQNALWSARRVYEALDNYVINQLGIDTSTLSGEKRVLENTLIQQELFRQARDLRELSSAGESNIGTVAKRFRARSLSEAGHVFQRLK